MDASLRALDPKVKAKEMNNNPKHVIQNNLQDA